MGFSDKLVYLMDFYKINNSKLSKGINVDPSLISRWKSGLRIPPRNSTYISDIAKYFISLSKFPYQVEYLKKLIKVELPHTETESIAELTQFLSDWLLSEDSSDNSNTISVKFAITNDNVVDIINNIVSIMATTDNFEAPARITDSSVINRSFFTGQLRKYELFKGREGKRQAVLNFLNMILSSSKSLELLLTSNEDIRWMTEDKEFLQVWAKNLRTIIDMGHRITIIHAVNRDNSEILSILNYWMPLHLTGRLKSYYYPKYTENRLKATYFIIRDTASIVSFNSDGSEHTEATLFFKEPFETKIFESNFLTYLSECKPLMNIYSENNIEDYYKQLLSLEEQTGAYYETSNFLNGLFIPNTLLDTLVIDHSFKDTSSLLLERINTFKKNLSRYKHIFVLPVDLLDKITFEREYVFPKIDLLYHMDLKIGCEVLISYFENVIKFLTDYDTLEIYLIKNRAEPMNKVSISFKEYYSSSFISYLPNGTPIAVVLKESNVLNSLELYFEDYINNIPISSRRKEMVIEKLNKVICNMKQ